jgi:hypothetical protein
MTQHPQNIPAQECPCAKVQMTQGGKKMTHVYHSFSPSLRRNHNENMLLLLEGDIWYPEVKKFNIFEEERNKIIFKDPVDNSIQQA